MKSLILIFCMLITVSIFAQEMPSANPIIDGYIDSIVNTTPTPSTYSVTISVKLDEPNLLESAAIKYKFNGDALGLLPIGNNVIFANAVDNYVWTIVEGHNGFYKFVDIIIKLKAGSTAVTIPTTPLEFVTLEFEIIDETQTADFCPLAIHFTGINGTWNLGDWDCDYSVLPVELISFTVGNVDNDVTLNWSTATELNNYGFNIERNVDGTWKNIGFVAGHGNSNSTKNYEYIDNPTLAGTYSYRLKQVDNDGTYEYSNVVEIDIVVNSYTLFQNFPNPFNPETTIKYEIKNSGNVALKVYDILGNEVAILVNEHQTAGIYYMGFDASFLTSGVYMYRLSVDNFVFVNKMTLLR